MNKKRLMKNFLTWVKNIWQSELLSFNKVIVRNTFAIPVLTTAVRLIDWTIEEIKEVDIRRGHNINDECKLPSERKCR